MTISQWLDPLSFYFITTDKVLGMTNSLDHRNRWKKLLIVPLLLGSVSPHAYGITNIESERIAAPPEGYSGHAELGLAGKQGNTDEIDWELSAKLIHKAGPRTWLGIVGREYGKTNDVKDTDKSFAHLRRVQEISPRRAVEGYTQYRRDEFRDLKDRTLIGGGYRIERFTSTPQRLSAIGIGAFYEYERELINGLEQSNETVRLATYWTEKRQLNAHVSFTNTLYLQPSLEDASDLRGLDQLSLSVSLVDPISLQVGLEATYDSKPPPGIENTDVEYQLGFRWDF